MKTYQIELKGLSDMIQHRDNIDWAGEMKRWREDPKNKNVSVAGDDRSPAFTWIGSLYHDEENVVVPSDNLMRCLMEGGAMVVVPGGKNGKTFKSQTQSGMVVIEESWPLLVNDKPIPVKPLLALSKEKDFDVHCETARTAGFMLYVKRSKIGASKHIRVRPRFSNWAVSGTLQVWDEQLTLNALRAIVTSAGAYKGLCDWRPGSKTPGPFGRFSVEIKEVASG